MALRTPQRCGALPATEPYLPLTGIQGLRDRQKEKRTLPGAIAGVSGLAYVTVCRLVRVRESYPSPLSMGGADRALHTGLPHLLGSTNPCPIAVHMEPFSTSVFKVLI